MRTPRLCLCFLLISCLLTSCIESVRPSIDSSNKDGLPACVTTTKNLYEKQKAALNVVLFEEPIKEVQRKPFRIQPKLLMNNTLEKVNKNVNESQLFYYVIATLKQSNESNVSSLIGDDTVEFLNNWANFSNLAISHFGKSYCLEFSIYSSDNDSCLSTVISSSFDIEEFPFHVFMTRSDPVQLTQNTFRVTIMLSLWDFTTNMFAQPNSLNDTIWYYTITITQNEIPVDDFNGEINGSFPLRSYQTPTHIFNLTNVGYRYQFDITIHSPSFTTRVKNISAPFDVLVKMPKDNSKNSTIALTFNGSSEEINGVKDKFYTIFLNHFGRRHPDVRWTEYTFRKSVSTEEIVIQVTLGGTTEDVDEAVENIWKDVTNSHYIIFENKTYVLQNIFEVDGAPYPNRGHANTEVTLFGLPVTAVFTIVLMSFLCSSFVVLVIIWRIRERKLLESYNRRMKGRSRQNGHVNTAFDSNESVPERNVYYMAVNGRHAKENGYNPDRETRIRRCSSGGVHRNYRRMRRMGSDEGETFAAMNGVPLDDDIVFTDMDKHDDVFRDVYFSPTSECLPTFASSSSSFHDEYLLKDVQAHSGRANYAHIPMHKYKGSKRKCSVTASTVSGSLNSLTISRSASRMLSNSTIDSYSLHRPPVGWSSHDDNKLCNGSRGLKFANPTFS